jgi:hypothetical protein
MVFRLVSSRRGVMCCEWTLLPENPRVGDYVWMDGIMVIFDGGKWA